MNDDTDDDDFTGEPDFAHGPPRCLKCGKLIDFVSRWWPHPTQGKSNWVVVDVHPEPNAIVSYVETSIGEFTEVYRHKCYKPPLADKQPYQSKNWQATKAPPKKPKRQKNQGELKF